MEQALAKIKAKHADTNFTLTLPEYEEILDALVGSHFQNLPSHYSHTDHDELGKLLVGVSIQGRMQLQSSALKAALSCAQSWQVALCKKCC